MSTEVKDSPLEAAGEVQVQPLLCKSCGLCAEYCPQQLMKPATEIPADDRAGPVMSPSGHVVYEIHDPENRCTGCGICATACPEGAVVVYRRKKPKPEPRAVQPEPRAEARGCPARPYRAARRPRPMLHVEHPRPAAPPDPSAGDFRKFFRKRFAPPGRQDSTARRRPPQELPESAKREIDNIARQNLPIAAAARTIDPARRNIAPRLCRPASACIGLRPQPATPKSPLAKSARPGIRLLRPAPLAASPNSPNNPHAPPPAVPPVRCPIPQTQSPGPRPSRRLDTRHATR